VIGQPREQIRALDREIMIADSGRSRHLQPPLRETHGGHAQDTPAPPPLATLMRVAHAGQWQSICEAARVVARPQTATPDVPAVPVMLQKATLHAYPDDDVGRANRALVQDNANHEPAH
jgi:hypothetical protein